MIGFASSQTKSASAARDTALASQLASRAQSLLFENPADLEISALLAVESMKRLPSAEGDNVLRSALVLLRKPFRVVPHTRDINFLALSPGGSWLATATDNNMVRIIVVNRGDSIKELRYDHRIAQIVFSPDEQLVAIASENILEIFDTYQKQVLHHLQLEAPIVALAFGRLNRLAAGTQDGVAIVFDSRKGDRITSFAKNASLRILTFDPQAKLLAVASGKVVRLFDVETKKPALPTPLEHLGPVRSLAFNPAGSLIATGSEDGSARLFNTKTGAEVSKLDHGLTIVNAVAFSEDGQMLATASTDNFARVFSVNAKCKEVSRLRHKGPVNSIVFAATNKIVVTSSADRTARLFESATGHEVARLVHPRTVAGIAVDQQTGTVATASAGIARLFSVTRGNNLAPLWDVKVGSAAFSLSGKIAIAAGQTIRIFAENGMEQESPPKMRDPITNLALSADGKLIAITTATGTTKIQDHNTIQTIANSDKDLKSASYLAFSGDSTMLAIAGNSTVSPGQHQSYIRTFKVSGGEQGGPRTCQGLVRSLDISRGHDLAALGTSEEGCIFHLNSNYTVERLDGQTINTTAFSQDGTRVAFGTEQGIAYVFDSKGTQLFSTEKQEAPVIFVLFTDNHTLALVTQDGSLRVFDIAEKKPIARFSVGTIKAVAFLSGQFVTLASDETGSFLQTHPLAAKDLIEEACFLLSRNLLLEEWKTYGRVGHYAKTCPNLP